MPTHRIAVTMNVVVEADSQEVAESIAVQNTKDELLLRRFRVEVATPVEMDRDTSFSFTGPA